MPAPARRTAKPSADRILEAAEQAFARHGYAEISLRQLMAAARVSTTAFYARFDSKEAVLAALTTRLFTELYDDARAHLPPVRDLASGIDRGVDLLCDRFGPRKALVRLILSEAGGSETALRARRQAYELLAGFLVHRFAALVARKRVAIPDPQALAWALIGALEIQFVRWALWDDLDLPALRAALRAAARAVLPRSETP